MAPKSLIFNIAMVTNITIKLDSLNNARLNFSGGATYLAITIKNEGLSEHLDTYECVKMTVSS